MSMSCYYHYWRLLFLLLVNFCGIWTIKSIYTSYDDVSSYVPIDRLHQHHRSLLNESTNRDNPEFYEPTAVELRQGTVFAAPTYWGVHLRRSKSLRVAFIGGSQTINGGYVNMFQETMNSTASTMGWSFKVYNEGISGQYPSIRQFKFLSLPLSDWPNVICIEPCLECATSKHLPCSLTIDDMKYFINRQYEQNNLDPPYYVFLEFFETKEMVLSTTWNTTSSHLSDSIERVSQPMYALNSKYKNSIHDRGSPFGMYMMDMARFYGIPVLSVVDVLYPSWVRFRLTHAEQEGWPYATDDGFSADGCKLVVEHILKPFFLDQMSPRESDKLYEKALQFSPYPVDLRMFRSDLYKNVVNR